MLPGTKFRSFDKLPTDIVSVSTFTAPSVTAPVDLKQNPTQAVFFWLRRDIARGVFAPLERLRVEFLTKFYKIGHSPVREAILLLSSSGLIVHEHQKGYHVAPVSLADYDDLRNVYQRIYRLALDLALDQGDEAWEERVVVQLHRSLKVQKVLLDGDPQAREMWQRAYGDLHYEILSGCGSPLLLSLYRSLGYRLERYVNLFADLETDRYRNHHAEHKAIVDALVARDRMRVFALMENYFATGEPIRQSVAETLKSSASIKRALRGADTAPNDATAKSAAPRRRGRPRKTV
jgi:GntR family carbon starvation induced transcriptional regulator